MEAWIRQEERSSDDYEGVAFVLEELSDASILHVCGELVAAVAAAFESALAGAVRLDAPLVVDLTGCTFVEAAALTVLARARRALGRRVQILGPERGVVRRVLDVTGFTTGLPNAAC